MAYVVGRISSIVKQDDCKYKFIPFLYFKFFYDVDMLLTLLAQKEKTIKPSFETNF